MSVKEIEEKIAKEVVAMAKTKDKISKRELIYFIREKIEEENYLKEDWQIDYAVERIKEKVLSEAKDKYEGLGGWLILVIIGLFATVLSQAYGIYENISLLTNKLVIEINIPGYMGLLWFELLGEIIFLIFSGYLIYLFFKKNNKFSGYYISFLISLVIYSIIDYLIFSSLVVPTNEIRQLFNEISFDVEQEIARSIIFAIIWGSYMKKSKRVKATFVNK